MYGLSGVRVLEVGQHVAVPWAAKLLADLGAEVLKVEPPGGDIARHRGPWPAGGEGDPERSGLFLALNTNKKGLVLDLDDPESRVRLGDLVAEADIVLHDLTAAEAAAAGLDASALLAARPELVVCSVTPFGHTGPRAEWAGEELTVVHGGGWGWLVPGDGTDPELPPLTLFGHPAHQQAGTAAAMVSLAAHDRARRTGVGDHVDLSVRAYVAGLLEAAFVAWSYVGLVAGRNDGRLLAPWRIYPCRDGLIFLAIIEDDQWDRLVEMMGHPDWAGLEVFADGLGRTENQDVLSIYIEEWTSKHTVDELFHEGQRRRICFAPVFTMADLAEQEHLRHRGFFETLTHPDAGELTYLGSPAHLTPSPWRLRSPAPRLDEHRTGRFFAREPWAIPTAAGDGVVGRPLEGVRVVDFSWVWAGPFCTLQLAFLGAEVIKIESSDRPSLGRRLPLHPPDVEPTLNTSGYFNQWDQAKQSVELDLTEPAAVEQALDLVATADVVVDNYATGVMERLGLGDDVLRAANPEVIIASVTGYGRSGPLREYMGYGPTTAPLSGLTSMTGHVGGKPEEAGISFGDPAAGLAAALSIVVALFGRRRGDEPARIDVSLWEATAVNAVEGWMAHQMELPPIEPMGNRHPTQAPHGVFRSAGDDEWVTIACMTDEQWGAMAALVGGEAGEARFERAAGRKRHEDELERLIGDWTATRDRWAVTDELQALGIAAHPSMTTRDLEDDVQLIAREFWEHHNHPEVGVRTHSGVPWRMAKSPNGVPHRAPLLGEHTEEYVGPGAGG